MINSVALEEVPGSAGCVDQSDGVVQTNDLSGQPDKL